MLDFWLSCGGPLSSGCSKFKSCDCDVGAQAQSRFVPDQAECNESEFAECIYMKELAAASNLESNLLFQSEKTLRTSNLSPAPLQEGVLDASQAMNRTPDKSEMRNNGELESKTQLYTSLELHHELEPPGKTHDVLKPSPFLTEPLPTQLVQDVSSKQPVQAALSSNELQLQLKHESLPSVDEHEQAIDESEQCRQSTNQNNADGNSALGRNSLRDRLSFWTNTDAQECGFFFFATGTFLEREHAPNGLTWAEYLAPLEPTFLDNNHKDLIGPWQECMHAAVVYENSNPAWKNDPEHRMIAPSQQVTEFFEACGHSDRKATLEQAMHNKRKQLQSSGASGISSSRASSPGTSVMSNRWRSRELLTMSRDSRDSW